MENPFSHNARYERRKRRESRDNGEFSGVTEHQRAMEALGEAAASEYMNGIDYRPEPHTPLVKHMGSVEDIAQARREQMYAVPDLPAEQTEEPELDHEVN